MFYIGLSRNVKSRAGVPPDDLLAGAAGLLDFRLHNYTFLPLVSKKAESKVK